MKADLELLPVSQDRGGVSMLNGFYATLEFISIMNRDKRATQEHELDQSGHAYVPLC